MLEVHLVLNRTAKLLTEHQHLGAGDCTKTDEFPEKMKTVFDHPSPPVFRRIIM